MRVERFFHIRPCVPARARNSYNVIAEKGGATVRILGNTELDTVSIQVTYCSADDQFCRATGRDVASKHPFSVIPVDSIPQLLQDVARNVTRNVLKLSRLQRKQHHLWNQDYSFAIKYFQTKKETVGV